MALPPLDLRHYRDDELDAVRSIGRDEDGEPCYYTHRYTLSEPRSDDGEEFYEHAVWIEHLVAWRLRDERWLIRRVAGPADSCRALRPFFSFGDQMPR